MINVVHLMNSLAFPGKIEQDFITSGINDSLHSMMAAHIIQI